MGCSSSQTKEIQSQLQQKIGKTLSPLLTQHSASQLKKKMKDVTNYTINQTKLYIAKKHKKYLQDLNEKAFSSAEELKNAYINQGVTSYFEAITGKIKKLHQNIQKDLQIYEKLLSRFQRKISPKTTMIIRTQMELQEVKTQIYENNETNESEQRLQREFFKKARHQKSTNLTIASNFQSSIQSEKIIYDNKAHKMIKDTTEKYQKQLTLLRFKIKDMQQGNFKLQNRVEQLNKSIAALIYQNNRSKSQVFRERQDSLSQNIQNHQQQSNVAQSIFIIDRNPCRDFRRAQTYSQTQICQESQTNHFASPFVEKQALKLFNQSKILMNLENIGLFMNTRIFIRSLFKQKIKTKLLFSSKLYQNNLKVAEQNENLLVLISLQSGQILGGFFRNNNKEKKPDQILFRIKLKTAFANINKNKLRENPQIKLSQHEELQVMERRIGKNCLAIKLDCGYLLQNYMNLFQTLLGEDLSHSRIQKYEIHEIQFQKQVGN